MCSLPLVDIQRCYFRCCIRCRLYTEYNMEGHPLLKVPGESKVVCSNSKKAALLAMEGVPSWLGKFGPVCAMWIGLVWGWGALCCWCKAWRGLGDRCWKIVSDPRDTISPLGQPQGLTRCQPAVSTSTIYGANSPPIRSRIFSRRGLGLIW